jgi:hypothetical protein
MVPRDGRECFTTKAAVQNINGSAVLARRTLESWNCSGDRVMLAVAIKDLAQDTLAEDRDEVAG